jgi:hypothetical protein
MYTCRCESPRRIVVEKSFLVKRWQSRKEIEVGERLRRVEDLYFVASLAAKLRA